MEIKYLEEFVKLAETLNFQVAAEELYISQPTLSRHIKLLEDELSVSLFDRTTRSIKLSAAGRAFLPHAQQVISTYGSGLTSLKSAVNQRKTTLTLGVLPTFDAHGVLKPINTFRRAYPGYAVDFVEGANTPELERSVLEDRCEVAFGRYYSEAPVDPGLIAIPHSESPLCVCLPTDHPLARDRVSLPVSELDGMEFFMTPSPTEKQAVDQLMKLTGVELKVSYIDRIEAIIGMVADGNCAAIVTDSSHLRRRIREIALLELEPRCTNVTRLIYSKSRPLTQAARNFIELIFPDHFGSSKS